MSRMIEWLEDRRKASEKTPRQFALLLGISPSLYVRLLKGEREPGNKVRNAVKSTFPDAPASLFLPSGLHKRDTRLVK